jgi:NADH-quinone oxidoreductase subunit J
MVPVLFIGFGAMLVIASLLVVLHRNPVTSALFLVVAFCSLGGLYLLMQAEFIGMVQIIVYAGAIMVLFLFVIMYLNLGRDIERGMQHVLRRTVGWLLGASLLTVALSLFATRWGPGPASTAPPALAGNTQAIGLLLYSSYLFPFEITSVLLLVAMVGVIVIAKGRRSGPPLSPDAKEEGP